MSDVSFYLDGHGKAAAFIAKRIEKFFGANLVPSPPDSGIVVELSVQNPLIDEKLLAAMIEASRVTGHAFKAVDAIPGTDPVQVGIGAPHEYFSNMQHRYCTNFSIGRPNRRKIFGEMEKRFPDLFEWPIERFLSFVESEDGVDFVIAYGEPISLEKFSTCPSCHSVPQPLFLGTSHPITGFLTKNVSIYSHCINCGLTFLNRQMPKAELWRYYQDYSYTSPQSAREVFEFFQNLSEDNVSHFANYVAVTKYISALQTGARIGDVGAGNGEFAVLAKQARPDVEVIAFEWRFSTMLSEELNRRGVVTVIGDFDGALPTSGCFQVLTAWEVVEHLKVGDLAPFFGMIKTALEVGGHFILSTPDFHNRYARALDFWATAPGEHISVLTRQFLEPLLRKAGFEVVEEFHESVTLKRPNDWFAFGATTDVHFSSKAASSIINDFLGDDVVRERIRQNAREKNLGSELILVCRAV